MRNKRHQSRDNLHIPSSPRTLHYNTAVMALDSIIIQYSRYIYIYMQEQEINDQHALAIKSIRARSSTNTFYVSLARARTHTRTHTRTRTRTHISITLLNDICESEHVDQSIRSYSPEQHPRPYCSIFSPLPDNSSRRERLQ